ncbi:CoA pyrophosphatase [Gammaproteobacteria bacterium]|nr:CoA pyrophosphatase [Gammaproteobacteria bacterium]
MTVLSIAELKRLTCDLGSDHSLEQHRDRHRLAAVLILVYQGIHEPEIILTRRSSTLANHAGQISFPGGTVEEGDSDPVHTALREAREEIDLQEHEVEVLGIMETTTLPSGFAIAPVLGVMESLPRLTANPGEVEEIFSIPLSMANDLSRYQMDFLEKDGLRRDFYYLQHDSYYIWGATAKMLRELALHLNPGSKL